jgi:hypothetical protein
MQIRTIAILGVLMIAAAGSKPVCAQVEVSVNASVRANFSDLDEYGEWIHVHGYGTVWRPDAEAGWRPFTYGHWVNTRDGWMWDSDEPFGWIVCHYGNWYNDPEQGWIWVPGYEWSPARVQWSVTDREIAWAPLPPPLLAGHHHHGSVSVEWMSCPAPFFTAPDIRAHVEVRAEPYQSETRVRVYSSTPPRLDFVRRVARAPVVTVVPNRVRVARGERPIVRVEVQDQSRPHVVVPVGPKFRRVTVHSEVESSNDVKVKTEQDVQQRVRPETESTSRPHEDRPSARVRVESTTDRDADRDNDHSVKVRTKKDDDVRVKVETR